MEGFLQLRKCLKQEIVVSTVLDEANRHLCRLGLATSQWSTPTLLNNTFDVEESGDVDRGGI